MADDKVISDGEQEGSIVGQQQYNRKRPLRLDSDTSEGDNTQSQTRKKMEATLCTSNSDVRPTEGLITDSSSESSEGSGVSIKKVGTSSPVKRPLRKGRFVKGSTLMAVLKGTKQNGGKSTGGNNKRNSSSSPAKALRSKTKQPKGITNSLENSPVTCTTTDMLGSALLSIPDVGLCSLSEELANVKVLSQSSQQIKDANDSSKPSSPEKFSSITSGRKRKGSDDEWNHMMSPEIGLQNAETGTTSIDGSEDLTNTQRSALVLKEPEGIQSLRGVSSITTATTVTPMIPVTSNGIGAGSASRQPLMATSPTSHFSPVDLIPQYVSIIDTSVTPHSHINSFPPDITSVMSGRRFTANEESYVTTSGELFFIPDNVPTTKPLIQHSVPRMALLHNETTSTPSVASNINPGVPSNINPGVPSSNIPGAVSNFNPEVPSNIIPRKISNIIPGVPSNIIPGVPSIINPGVTSNIIPGAASNIISGVPSNIIPGVPSNITPGVPSNITPGVTSNIIPGFPSNIISGVPSNIIPGVPSNITPGVTSNITPGATSNIIPGVTSNITPGVTSNITPGGTSNIIPGVTSNITPGVTSNITPRVTSNITPGVISTSFSFNPNITSPVLEMTTSNFNLASLHSTNNLKCDNHNTFESVTSPTTIASIKSPTKLIISSPAHHGTSVTNSYSMVGMSLSNIKHPLPLRSVSHDAIKEKVGKEKSKRYYTGRHSSTSGYSSTSSHHRHSSTSGHLFTSGHSSTSGHSTASGPTTNSHTSIHSSSRHYTNTSHNGKHRHSTSGHHAIKHTPTSVHVSTGTHNKHSSTHKRSSSHNRHSSSSSSFHLKKSSNLVSDKLLQVSSEWKQTLQTKMRELIKKRSNSVDTPMEDNSLDITKCPNSSITTPTTMTTPTSITPLSKSTISYIPVTPTTPFPPSLPTTPSFSTTPNSITSPISSPSFLSPPSSSPSSPLPPPSSSSLKVKKPNFKNATNKLTRPPMKATPPAVLSGLRSPSSSISVMALLGNGVNSGSRSTEIPVSMFNAISTLPGGAIAYLDAINYADIERQYRFAQAVLETQQIHVDALKSRLMQARIQQQVMLLNSEHYKQCSNKLTPPPLDFNIPVSISGYKTKWENSLSPEQWQGSFEKPLLECIDFYNNKSNNNNNNM